ncbi:MAG: ABC transporter substrate-binding protein [Desulfurococcaceae archaeon]|jgi:ABC-type transport system substrate-binding protein|nr:ABC transporter substrate-binding protein [Desulfurococcaceae archaeon]
MPRESVHMLKEVMNVKEGRLTALLLAAALAGSVLGGLLLVGYNHLTAYAQAWPTKGARLSFEMLSLPWFPLSDKAAEVVAEQLKKVGIEIRLVKLESAAMYPRIMQTFDYDAFALAVSQSPDPTGMLNAFHSRNAIPGGSNYWGYRNPAVDQLIDKVLSSNSVEEAKRIAWKIQEELSRGPFIPLYISINTQVIRAEWKNYTLMPGGILEALNRWSILYMYKSDKPEENVFRIAFPADILTLNPFTATDLRSIWVLGLIYEPLVALSPDLRVVPWLAERWEVSPDGKVYTFYLKRGVRFHDGKELTADDVVFTYEFGIRNKAARFIGTVSELTERIEKVDDYTVRFVLKSPSVFFLTSLATSYQFIAPKHIWADKNVTWANPNPIGTGPFKFVSRVPGESIVLERNENYHIPGTPKIARIVVRVIPEAETRYYSIKRGDVDAERYATSYTLIEDAKKDPNLKVILTPDIWLVYIAFNYRRYNDTRIFEAINYAINRTEIIEKAAGGYGIPVYTILNKEWHKDFANTNITFPYDPKRAVKILEEAGWVPGPDGIRVYVGPKEVTTPATPTPTTPPPTTPYTSIAIVAIPVVVVVVIGVLLLTKYRTRRG